MLIPNPAPPIKRKVGVDDFGKVRVEMHSNWFIRKKNL